MELIASWALRATQVSGLLCDSVCLGVGSSEA